MMYSSIHCYTEVLHCSIQCYTEVLHYTIRCILRRCPYLRMYKCNVQIHTYMLTYLGYSEAWCAYSACALSACRNAWFAIDLGLRVVPTAYTLRHSRGYGRSALRNWSFQVSKDGKDWLTLRTHTNDTSLNEPGCVRMCMYLYSMCVRACELV